MSDWNVDELECRPRPTLRTVQRLGRPSSIAVRMSRGLLAVVSATIVALTTAPVASAYTYTDCIDVNANYSPTWHVIRNTSTYFAAQGEVVVRQLRGCTDASGTLLQNCSAQVWPANMQGAGEFKQIGYANVGSPSNPPTCNSSAMNWWATCCSGFTENVTQMSLAFYPAIGDTIRFSIYRYAPGGLVYWRLKVDDLSHAGWWGWRELVQSAPSVGSVWYGIEDHSLQSQFGSNSSSSQVRLRGLSYRLSNGSAWTYLTGSTGSAAGFWANDLGYGVPGCWAESVTTYAGPIASNQTSVNGYTANCP